MLKKFTTILLSILMLLVGAIGLTACEDIPQDTYYIVTFELNGGSVEDKDLSNGISVKENTVINFSEYVPTKTDYSFDGWLLGETLYTSTDTFTVTEDVTFSAQWTDLVAQALASAKTTAKASLETYVNAEDYRQAQQEEVATAIANGKNAIENAIDVAGVETALANAKGVIDDIKTDAELTAEETAQALATAKTTAKTTLETYVNAEDYRQAQQEELATAIANGKNAIENATDVAGVETALANAKGVIDDIKTDAELTAEETAQALATAKTTAKTTLETYVNAEDYRQAQQEELATAIANGKNAIDNATDVAGVETALADAKTVIDEIKTNAELTAEEETLATAKTTAKASLETYVNASEYREAQQEEIATAIANGKNAIDNATDVAGVETALANAKATIDALETDAQITAKEPTIETAFTNGQVFTNTRATLDVVGRKANGDKLSASKVTVMVNGEKASVNWDDNVKASYNFVFVEGENTIVITAVDGSYTKTVTYVVTCDLEKAATITVSIEAFTVGLGYLVEPIEFELNNTNLSAMAEYYGKNSVEEFKEVLSMAHVLDYVLYLNGYEMSYQGALESTYNGFYMSSISGIADTSTIVVPVELYEVLEENGYYPEEYVYDEGTLCEFDVTWGSGWMYMVNGVFPNVPFCDYVPQDGDVMRVQFTLAYGSDIGDWGIMGEPFFDVVDREPLTKLIAKALALDIDVSEAVEVISTFGVTQEELDAACQTLETSIKAKNNE